MAQTSRERQSDYRRQQFRIIGGVLALTIVLMIALSWASGYLLRRAISSLGASLNHDEITAKQRHQLRRIRQRVLPIIRIAILVIFLLWAMGRFPETRVLQQNWLAALKIPVLILIVAIVAYVGIRLSYAVVDKLLLGMTDDEGFSSEYSRRTRLRISTLSSVIKNVANFIWITVGLVVALSVTGLNFGVVLASVGVIGLAISLAARNLVAGALQGFFIVLEDQFAIGDVVQIDANTGIVENLNLRITQLRDADGRLITIPTNDIVRVANYSLHWSRADLKLPVHYRADINHMLDITHQVGQDMQNDPDWGDLILDNPNILGVDDFDDSAIIIRVWIKTQPMKQWDVSREYRRRFKLALQESDTSIPFPQRDVWLHPSEELMGKLEGSLKQLEQNGSASNQSNGQSEHPQTNIKTDPQPRGVPDEGEAAGEEGE